MAIRVASIHRRDGFGGAGAASSTAGSSAGRVLLILGGPAIMCRHRRRTGAASE